MDIVEQIGIVRGEIDAAVDTILGSTIEALALAPECAGDPGKVEQLEQTLHRILEACAFHDLVSQRFDRLTNLAASADPLLNGPQNPGEGLDQAAADRLLDDLMKER